MTEGIYVFISYSRVDAEFVRKLDATFSIQGISSFLDERDIKIGESFPERIYGEISRATHLVYIISEASVKSRWVQEELQAAKVRQLGGKGLVVLPILIEKMEPPPSIAHINYADMSGWKVAEIYQNGIEKILSSLGFKYSISSKPESDFLLMNIRLYLSVLIGVSRFGGYVEGAKNADYLGARERGDGVGNAIKWDIDSVEGSEFARNQVLARFIKELKKQNKINPSKSLQNLERESQSLYDQTNQRALSSHWKAYEVAEKAKAQATRLSLMLKETLLEVISISQSRMDREHE